MQLPLNVTVYTQQHQHQHQHQHHTDAPNGKHQGQPRQWESLITTNKFIQNLPAPFPFIIEKKGRAVANGIQY